MKGKTFILIILMLFVGTCSVLLVIPHTSYEEGVLYNQSDLSDYNEEELTNRELITRNRAIERATTIIRDIVGIDLTDGNPMINVNIYKNADGSGMYNWDVWWLKKDTLEKYGVTLNAKTGEIMSIFVNYVFEEENENPSKHLTKDELVTIIDPFVDFLNLNLEEYELIIRNSTNSNVNGSEIYYENLFFENKKNNEYFLLTIDLKSRKIIEYRKGV